MNDYQREKLRLIFKEILDEEVNLILNEIRGILTSLINDDVVPVIEIETGTMIGCEQKIDNNVKPISTEYSPSSLPDLKEITPNQHIDQSACPDEIDKDFSQDNPDTEGLYLYGIANGSASIHLGPVGIEGCDVYTIPYKNLCAIVHACPTNPYENKDKEIIEKWVFTHQKIIEKMSEQYDTVMPFSFDTIIKPDGESDAKTILIQWMSKEYEQIINKINKISGKKEYGVQIFYNPSMIGEKISEINPVIKNLQEVMIKRGPGAEFMLRQKIEKELKISMESEINSIIEDIYKRINEICDDIKVEKNKKDSNNDKKMLINCSCLVSDDNYIKLGDVLEDIQNCHQVNIRFTGPWPVYSFV